MLSTLSASLYLCRPLRTSLLFSTQTLLTTSPQLPYHLTSLVALLPLPPISKSHQVSPLQPIPNPHFMSCVNVCCCFSEANAEQNEEEHITGVPKVDLLKQKLEILGIICSSSCVPGHYCNVMCPKCNGGKSLERSLSLYIVQKGDLARWRCFRIDCNWADKVFLDGKAGVDEEKKRKEIPSVREMTVEGLRLVPIGHEITAYFSERKISAETLQRNAVMQLSKEDVIAFTYRQKGLLVGCKYRTLEKRFWMERGSQKILYGIDDIDDATEIIIVEGEIDKLSVEEAGFFNCVSAPGGGAGKNTPTLPSIEKDTTFQYLWNCKEVLDKVSRIILATDNDATGQALARALARRLGTNRCWQVSWPKKDESSFFKDANEVLKYMGSDALRRVIESAEPYQLCTSEAEIN